MDIEQFTEATVTLVIEHMQNAIAAAEKWEAEMYCGWAYGARTLWGSVTLDMISEEKSLSIVNDMRTLRDNADKHLDQLLNRERVPALKE